MPNYKGHLAGGIVLYALILVCLMPAVAGGALFEWLCFVCAGALFPDIDTKSKGQRFFFGLLALILIILFARQQWVPAGFLAVAACTPLLVHHRGIFHNIVFLTVLIIVLSAGAIFLLPHYKMIIVYDAFFFWIGVFSHIWLDCGLRKTLKRI